MNIVHRRDGYTFIRKHVYVSTVYLGIGDRRWYETMIFGGESHGYQQRHRTRDAAAEAHADAVEMARANPRTLRASKGWRRHVRRLKSRGLYGASRDVLFEVSHPGLRRSLFPRRALV